jgi:hypothetical protein
MRCPLRRKWLILKWTKNVKNNNNNGNLEMEEKRELNGWMEDWEKEGTITQTNKGGRGGKRIILWCGHSRCDFPKLQKEKLVDAGK